MRRADRLFDIIQLLRSASGPVTALTLAQELEVTPRTIYRDVATLQARRIPIEGAPGLGYVLRRGFDLPPLMFTNDEVDAIGIGARLLQRTGDVNLQEAATRVISKIETVLPETLRAHLAAPTSLVSIRGAPAADLSLIREAIREERKLRIGYVDEQDRKTTRLIWPFAVAYYVEATLISAWCELRSDFRHFRADRMREVEAVGVAIPVPGQSLMAEWLKRFSGDVGPHGTLRLA